MKNTPSNVSKYYNCVHSRKRKGAPWKVYSACANKMRSFKSFELAYTGTCVKCRHFRRG